MLAKEDAIILSRWLSDPRVLEYYEGRDRPHDLDAVRQHFFNTSSEEEVTRCIIQYEDKPIGYIQYYHVAADEREVYGYDSFKGKIYGMDQFIGEPEYWNRGIGTKLIVSMVQQLTLVEKADKIVMDPRVHNERAIRVYEKCGFVKAALLPKHEYHEGAYHDCWVMEYQA
ncbi:acetyltransferase [Paenibacillus pini JCM 16418]|uniref:Acetyltransferase n=1 Tax=Paenibacillus pini JCM 16418 TaxID=1236976 RepID=W7Y6W8_9BACL|nr:acetyltransferase [Paenibacillus pini JCM 16418]